MTNNIDYIDNNVSKNIKTLDNNTQIFNIQQHIVQNSNINLNLYHALKNKFNNNFLQFWEDLALENLIWDIPFQQILDDSNPPFYKWFSDGELSVSYNCLDKHLHNGNANKIALIFESDDGKVTTITYSELLTKVCHMANSLQQMGFIAGERAIIYMPMSIEAIIAIHACVRIGIIHSVVFAGFSAKSLHERIIDAGASLIFTADKQYRGGKSIQIKNTVDEALDMGSHSIKKVIVYQRDNETLIHLNKQQVLWQEIIKNQEDFCPALSFSAEQPLFILYTSGSTGKPKGVQHSSAGYLLQAYLTMQWTFDIKTDDIFWCTADIGWITGHTYIVYAPLISGVTQIIYEGVPTYPNSSRLWQMIQKHKVTIFYTAPTAIRALIKANTNDETCHPKNFDLSSLRLLGSVGEPINPQAWLWYYEQVGNKNCPIVDTWWQTETGSHMMTPLIGIDKLKAGSCMKPLPGIAIDIVDEQGKSIENNQGGYLVIKKPWPSMIRTIWNDDERFKNTYFPKNLGGLYLAGDGAYRDNEGDYWIVGRIDDVLNVSGHRLGTIEIESALVAHQAVAEAAVVGYPDEITGEAIMAFVVLKYSYNDKEKENLQNELSEWVAKQIGKIARPKHIKFGSNLPKTRSGKIMRRLLRNIAKNEDITQDISTLDNPQILQEFIKNS